jgi:dynein heavy chain
MDKLEEAAVQLNDLNEKLAVQKVVLMEKTESCESLLAEIAIATKQAEEKKVFALSKSKEIEEQSKIIFVEKVN